jgi:hypothetical protein
VTRPDRRDFSKAAGSRGGATALLTRNGDTSVKARATRDRELPAKSAALWIFQGRTYGRINNTNTDRASARYHAREEMAGEVNVSQCRDSIVLHGICQVVIPLMPA